MKTNEKKNKEKKGRKLALKGRGMSEKEGRFVGRKFFIYKIIQ